MTDREKAQAAILELKSTTFGYRIRPNSPRWNRAMALLESIGATPDPPPPPPPPPPGPRLAPRAFNLGTNDSDPLFCVFLPNGELRPGITRIGPDRYADEGNHHYNGDGKGQDGGNWRTRAFMVPGLRPANETNSLPTCQKYWNGERWIGGDADYPAESYLR